MLCVPVWTYLRCRRPFWSTITFELGSCAALAVCLHFQRIHTRKPRPLPSISLGVVSGHRLVCAFRCYRHLAHAPIGAIGPKGLINRNRPAHPVVYTTSGTYIAAAFTGRYWAQYLRFWCSTHCSSQLLISVDRHHPLIASRNFAFVLYPFRWRS